MPYYLILLIKNKMEATKLRTRWHSSYSTIIICIVFPLPTKAYSIPTY